MCCEVDNKLDATRLDYSEPSCPSREEADDRDTEPTGSHQHLGFQRGMAIASLNINGLPCRKISADLSHFDSHE